MREFLKIVKNGFAFLDLEHFLDFLQIFGNKWLSHSDCAAKNPKIAWSPPLKGITQPDKLKTDQEMKITFFEKSKFL